MKRIQEVKRKLEELKLKAEEIITKRKYDVKNIKVEWDEELYLLEGDTNSYEFDEVITLIEELSPELEECTKIIWNLIEDKIINKESDIWNEPEIQINSIEKLKVKWLKDPSWNIYETEGFIEDKFELMQFQEKYENIWKQKINYTNKCEDCDKLKVYKKEIDDLNLYNTIENDWKDLYKDLER